eukprot:GHVU01139221.1.p2 GENE.GHVU01139221.1~~GHVU01139221.1.p2  ORF type:complete len:109 (-),score=4.06 GHVU01139221.1:2288-2614(-)
MMIYHARTSLPRMRIGRSKDPLRPSIAMRAASFDNDSLRTNNDTAEESKDAASQSALNRSIEPVAYMRMRNNSVVLEREQRASSRGRGQISCFASTRPQSSWGVRHQL